MGIKQLILAKRPDGKPSIDDFRIENTTLNELKEGQMRLQPLYISVDPYMRSRMNESLQPGAAFELNHPISGPVIAEVIESRDSSFEVNTILAGQLPWATQLIAGAGELQKIDTNGIPASAYLGLLGMPGLTGYFGMLEVGKIVSGETVVISGAGGAIGSIVGQIAKIKGCRVIGLTSDDKKATILKEDIGYDEVINYQTQNITDALKSLAPNGVDVYFDNVGGSISDEIIKQMNMYGRVVVCGQISTYNGEDHQTGTNLLALALNSSIRIQGYHIPTYKEHFPQAIQQLATWYKEGKLKNKETILTGFEQLPEAFVSLFSGKNLGKMLVKV